MKRFKACFPILTLLFLIQSTALAQSESKSDKTTDKVHCNRYRIAVKTLIPNIFGGTVEYVLPVNNNRLSLVADYSRIGIPEAFAQAFDFEGSIKASLSYLAIGSNFYLNQKGRAGGGYLGVRYQEINAKTTVIADESFTGQGKQKGLAFLFGLSTAGHFWTGMEIGAGMPLGPATGTSVEVVNGKSTRTNYSEKLIPVIPILNFRMGVSF